MRETIEKYPVEFYPFKSKWIETNGIPVHYIDEGEGQLILFCHPPITSSFMYRNIIPELAKNFRCIALDFPGFGLSREPHGYVQSIVSQADVIEQLVLKLGIADAFLLMQEVGGHAAMTVFMKYPERLKGVIITDTIVFPVNEYPRIERTLNFINSGLFDFVNVNFNFLVRAMTRFGIRKRRLSNPERETYKSMFNTKSKRRSITTLLHQLVKEGDLLRKIQHFLEVESNTISAVLIYGDEDPLTKMGVPERIKQMLPNAELHWIKSEAHFPHEGDPKGMVQIITSWLNQEKYPRLPVVNTQGRISTVGFDKR